MKKAIRRFFGLTTREDSALSTAKEPLSPREGGCYPWLAIGGDAMAIATVYRCVNLLADSVANLPVRVLRLKDGIFQPDNSDGNLSYLLNVQPDYYLSGVDFWRQTVMYLLLRGNAYIVPVRDPVANGYSRLVLVNPDNVSHDTINDTYTVNDLNAGISGEYGEGQIVHIKNYSRDGKRGLSTIGFARTTLDIANTGDIETLNRFRNGGEVRGIVGNDTSSVKGYGNYQDEQLRKLAESIDKKFSSGQNIVHLPGSVSWNPITMTAADMQFLEARKFTVRDICRFFGVHPSFVFDDTSNNYKSAEMANVAFLSNTLNPILRKIEIELLRKLVPANQACKRKFEFDRMGLYACDLDSKVKYQVQMLASGLATVNELRQSENRPPVEGGDKVLVSANLKSIDTLTSETANVESTITDNDNGEE